MTWKKPGHLTSRTQFCGTSRQCSSKSTKQGLSWKNLDSNKKTWTNRIPILVLYLKIKCKFYWRLCSARSSSSNPQVIYNGYLLHQSSWLRPKRKKYRYTWWHDQWLTARKRRNTVRSKDRRPKLLTPSFKTEHNLKLSHAKNAQTNTKYYSGT
jgi:hypothetical protein